jgi:hypothetical protein
MKMKIRVSSATVGIFLVFTATWAFAGPKVKRLQENARKIEKAVLVIAPVLPDSFILKRLEKKGPEAVSQYLDRIKTGNQNMIEAFKNHYTFSRILYLVDDPAMLTYEGYFARLRDLQPDSQFVFQFGQAEQYATVPARRIKAYDREVACIDRTDGKTRMFISLGNVSNLWQPGSAENMVKALQKNLEMYARMKPLVKKNS